MTTVVTWEWRPWWCRRAGLPDATWVSGRDEGEATPGDSTNCYIGYYDGGSGLSQLINCEDYSKLTLLLVITALILKFVKLLKQWVQRKVNEEAPAITSEDIMKAENHWIIDSQGGIVQQPKFKIWKHQLGLFQDKAGIWRCRGRLEHSALPPSSVYPVLSDYKHPLTHLIVMDCHGRVQHNGVKEMLTQLRSQYWLYGQGVLWGSCCTAVSSAVRLRVNHLHHCHHPLFQSLEWKNSLYSFTLEWNLQGHCMSRMVHSTERPGFVCTRAVWSELFTSTLFQIWVHPLSYTVSRNSDEFKRWGFQKNKVISDNGKTFMSAAKYIETIFKDPEVKTYFEQFRMEWQFNLERVPWWGGFFEWMVRSTKRCLKKTIGWTRLTYDELLTALAEVEMILNLRPLSYVSSEDLEELLTPSHLLIGQRALNLPDLTVYDKGVGAGPVGTVLTGPLFSPR